MVTTHMLVIPRVSEPRSLVDSVMSGFGLDRFSARMVGRITGETSPEELVHAGGISEVVGRPLAFPADHSVAGLAHFEGVRPAIGCKERIAGLQLRATDADWFLGEGPTVEGTTRHLVLATSGRRSALDHLTGEGVGTLRSRD